MPLICRHREFFCLKKLPHFRGRGAGPRAPPGSPRALQAIFMLFAALREVIRFIIIPFLLLSNTSSVYLILCNPFNLYVCMFNVPATSSLPLPSPSFPSCSSHSSPLPPHPPINSPFFFPVILHVPPLHPPHPLRSSSFSVSIFFSFLLLIYSFFFLLLHILFPFPLLLSPLQKRVCV